MKHLLFICTTPRTGSSMLRGDIRSTRAMGDPREWFNLSRGLRYHTSIKEWNVPNGDLDAYIEALKEHASTRNGVVGVKLFELHLQQMVRKGMLPKGPGRLRALAERFGTPDPVILTLTRNNKLRQAISFSKAKQTKQWGTQGRAKAKSKYDRKSIEADLMELIARENRWDRELEASGYIPDLSLIYEVLQHEREETLLGIARALELPDPEGVVASRDIEENRLARQADHRTEVWVNRFIRWK
jgi:LPS sulfotransferase NodH